MPRAAYHPPVSQATEHVDGEALARSLADLNLPDSDEIDVQGGIARVVRGAAGVFAGSGVGLMLIAEDGHSLRYVASSDEVARELELAHEQSGEGPCVDAFVLDSCVKTDDLATESRWPELRAALADKTDSGRDRHADAPRRAGRHAQRLLRRGRGSGTRARSPRSRPTTACSRHGSPNRC